MARPGETIRNPVTGERLTWRKVAADTGGRFLEGEMFSPPGGFIAAEHVHPKQEERFEVVTGTLTVRIDGREQTLGPGERAIVPAGHRHIWWNAGLEDVSIRVEVVPALHTEAFFETLFGLAADGKTDGRGLPNPLQLAVLSRGYADEVRLARPSPSIQRVLFGALATVGRLLGYRAWYPRYSTGPLEALAADPGTNAGAGTADAKAGERQ